MRQLWRHSKVWQVDIKIWNVLRVKFALIAHWCEGAGYFDSGLHTGQVDKLMETGQRVAGLEAENGKLRKTIDDVYYRALYADAIQWDYKTENEAWLDAIALLQEARGGFENNQPDLTENNLSEVEF